MSKNSTHIDKLVRDFMREQKVPGGTVAVSVDDRTVYARGFGVSDLEDGARASVDTQYRTASMGKPMAATAAFMLAKMGKLDFTAEVQRYCPRYPVKSWPVTVRDIVSHTSGIREPNDGDELYNSRHYQNPSDAITLFAADPLRWKPGKDFGYSTWNYVLLGCVIEGATGQNIRQIIPKMIFSPAGMTRTRDDDPRAIIAGRARGYLLENGTLRSLPGRT